MFATPALGGVVKAVRGERKRRKFLRAKED